MKIDETRAFLPVRIGVLTVSDTRTLETDKSGDVLEKLLTEDGHQVAERLILKDDAGLIAEQFKAWIAREDVDAIISTGGTGLTGRDVTPEALSQVAEKYIPGFGELFRMLSYETIGTSTMQSRADAALAGGTYIFILPGSTGACKDAWTKILRFQLDNRHRPCNLVELMPRLNEV